MLIPACPILLSLLLPPAFALSSALPAVSAPKRPVSDVFHGVTVSEDYRWLEQADEPEVKAWVAAQNKSTRAYLDGLPRRAALRGRLKAYYDAVSPSYYAIASRPGALFAMKFSPPRDQPLLVVLKSANYGADEKVLIDLNALDKQGHLSIDWFAPSPDGKKVAVAMSEKGSEDAALHFYDVASGKKLSDVLPRVQYPTAGGAAAWLADGSGVYYTRYPQGDERPKEDRNFYQQLYFHKLGADPKEDAYVIGKDFPRIAEIKLNSRGDGRFLMQVANGGGGEYAYYLKSGDAPFIQLTRFEDQAVSGAMGPDGSVYLLSRKDAPRGKILRLPAADPRLAAAKTVVSESADTAIGERDAPLKLTKNRLYVVRLAGGPNEVSVHELDGKELGRIPLAPVSNVAELVPWGGDTVLYRAQSYLEPAAWWSYDGKSKPRRTALFVKSPVAYDDAEVVRDACLSKDGTEVPVSIVRRKGAKLDGGHPTLLYAYGGYGISMSPRYLGADGRLWLDHDGVYAVANIRGGGEFGEAWHKAGMLANKQNVFDDFIACAERLTALGYAKPGRLAIEGRSSGGLLMGAVLTQRPELFRAVLSHVGIYDMVRSELEPKGAFNVTEFGTVKDPEQFKALFAYSPYHSVKDGVAYPAVLLTTGEHDGRVAAHNSHKMAARLQAAGREGPASGAVTARPILLRVSMDAGHGMGTALSEAIEERADGWAFLFDQLGVR